MIEVACFCGCCYSFDGGGGACPTCGEYATVTAGPAFTGTGRCQQEQPVPAMNGAQENRLADTAKTAVGGAEIIVVGSLQAAGAVSFSSPGGGSSSARSCARSSSTG